MMNELEKEEIRRAEFYIRLRAYMRDYMAMPNALEDQNENWTFGHMATFALKEVQLATRLSSTQGKKR